VALSFIKQLNKERMDEIDLGFVIIHLSELSFSEQGLSQTALGLVRMDLQPIFPKEEYHGHVPIFRSSFPKGSDLVGSAMVFTVSIELPGRGRDAG
jgi:hypothetical protein